MGKALPSPAFFESFIMHSEKTEGVSALLAGVGFFVTGGVVEKLCLALCQMTALYFI